MFKYQQDQQNSQEGGKTPDGKQGGKTPDGKQGYRPAVPISVYRELAKELQETKGELETVKQQNHQLTNENKLMRQELDKITQCVQAFQQVKGNPYEPNNPTLPLDRSPLADFSSEHQSPVPVKPAAPDPASSPLEPAFEEMDRKEEYVMEVEPPSKSRRFSLLDSSGDISGWLLAIAIALMVLTAFGAGFLFVRPWLLNNNNNN